MTSRPPPSRPPSIFVFLTWREITTTVKVYVYRVGQKKLDMGQKKLNAEFQLLFMG